MIFTGWFYEPRAIIAWRLRKGYVFPPFCSFSGHTESKCSLDQGRSTLAIVHVSGQLSCYESLVSIFSNIIIAGQHIPSPAAKNLSWLLLSLGRKLLPYCGIWNLSNALTNYRLPLSFMYRRTWNQLEFNM